jgi:hypothetical protein
MTNGRSELNPEDNTSRHAVTERWRCRKMQEKYGWKLLGIERTGDDTSSTIAYLKAKLSFPTIWTTRRNKQWASISFLELI